MVYNSDQVDTRPIVVPDSNIIVDDPESWFVMYPGMLIALPTTVLEELDQLKLSDREVSRAARLALNVVRGMIKRHAGQMTSNEDLSVKFEIGNNTAIQICFLPRNWRKHVPRQLDPLKPDHQIIGLALIIRDTVNSEVSLATRDNQMIILAHSLGIPTIDFSNQVDREGEYQGLTKVWLPSGHIEQMYRGELVPSMDDLYPNQGVILLSSDSTGHTGLGMVTSDGTHIRRMSDKSGQEISRVKARNVEQRIALELLLDKSIPLVTILGRAGSGKTLVAVAVALSMVQAGHYDRIIICRPTVTIGRDIGFLPGNIDSKMGPWKQPIVDCIQYCYGSERPKNNKKGSPVDPTAILMERYIQIEPIQYLRGRTFHRCFIIVDEAQNLSREEAEAIVTRVGEDSKIVFTGDVEQLDVKGSTRDNNGLASIVEAFATSALSGHIVLTDVHRSPLSEEASQRMFNFKHR